MKNIQAQYTDLLEGKMSQANFLRNVRMQFPQYVSYVSSFDDSVKILKGKRILSENKIEELSPDTKFSAYSKASSKSYTAIKYLQNHELAADSINEAKKPEGVYGHNPSAEVTLYPNFDTVNYTQLIKGMKFELAQMDEITDANMLLAKKMALKKLTKDPMAYRELVVTNSKEVAEMDKTLKMKEVKKGDMIDKPNGMKVVKKDAPAAANKSKKFTNKVEKIKQMTQTPKRAKGIEKVMEVPGKEKVMALKEALLKEFNSEHSSEHINVGARVMTKDKKKTGVVEKIEQDTATVKLDDDSLEHIQLNVLTMRDVPRKQNKAQEVKETVLSKDQEVQMGSGYPTKEKWNSMSEEDRFNKMMNSSAARYGEKQLKIRAKDDYDTLTKYNPRVKQSMAFPKSPLTANDSAEKKDFPIKGDIGKSFEKFKTSLKEKLTQAFQEVIFRDKKTGKAQSIGQEDPIMKDPDFNRVFKKA